MKRASSSEIVELHVAGVDAVLPATVTKFGTGAKVGCPKQFVGREVFVVVRALDSAREGKAQDPP
jgi:putative transposon-encoded protein